jgi:putative nucleotidyltransferase with HDIG domain
LILMISRGEAIELIEKYVRDDKLKKHMLAVEAIMRELAKNINEDEEIFGIVGLLHDIDFEETRENPELHGIRACEILNGLLPENLINAIKVHAYSKAEEAKNNLEYALIASDAISGLIIACALIKPSRKINDVDTEFISKKFKQKDFARNCNRERILFCKKLGITEEDFFEISLNALKKISNDLGL